MIYGKFIEVTGELAYQLNFISKTIGNDPERPIFHNILIEKSEIDEKGLKAVAVDGKRMHIVDPLAIETDEGLKEGRWRFLKYKPKLRTAWMAEIPHPSYEFVNYKKAIPTIEPSFIEDFELGFTGEYYGGELARVLHFLNSFPEPTVINPYFLADLGFGTWTVSWYERNKAVVFEKEEYKAIIMPCKT